MGTKNAEQPTRDSGCGRTDGSSTGSSGETPRLSQGARHNQELTPQWNVAFNVSRYDRWHALCHGLSGAHTRKDALKLLLVSLIVSTQRVIREQKSRVEGRGSGDKVVEKMLIAVCAYGMEGTERQHARATFKRSFQR